MGERGFQQRWEFRRNEDNDLDSSSDDWKSSTGPFLKKHKLVSSLISVGDDKTSETSRLMQKDNGENPGSGSEVHIGKARKRKTRNLSQMKRDSPGDVGLEKGETSAPLDDLKNFMDSLLKDLKVTRESLLKWMMEEMQKLVADGTSPEPKRRKSGHRGEKIHLQQVKKSKKVQDQHEKSHKESLQFQHPNNSEKSIQVQHHTNFQETVFQEKNNRQHQNDFRYGMRAQNCNNRSLVRFLEGFNAADSTDYSNALGDRVDSGQATELIASSKKNTEDILSKSVNPNLRASCADQNVQVQSQKSVVLAIEAQKSKAGALKRSGKGKKIVDLSNHYQAPEEHGGHGQAMRTAVSCTDGEKLGSSAVQNFLSSPSGQPPSSMYLTLPTVLTESIVANHELDASLCNYIQRRGVNSERVNQMLEPSSIEGSFPVFPPGEKIRSFALMGFRSMGCINQNGTPTSGIGTGFPVPLHQDVGLSIPRQFNPQCLSQETSEPPGLRMNGGAMKFSGESYNLSEQIATNNHHSHPAYKPDGRLMSYQIQNLNDGHLFLQ